MLFIFIFLQFCAEHGIEFLTMRVWIGFWLVVIGLAVVCVEGSVLVKRFTRFTEEIFASLISLLYIYESLVKLYQVFKLHPLLAVEDYCFPPEVMNFTKFTNETKFAESWSLVLEDENTSSLL
jgi:hypothetical protein